MYHKRRVKTTRNAICCKILGNELYYKPSLGKSTTCNEAIASTEREKNCEGMKLKTSNKKMWYILHYVSQTSGENHPKCTLLQNPRERALLQTLSWKKHTVHWSNWEYRAAWETTHAVVMWVTLRRVEITQRLCSRVRGGVAMSTLLGTCLRPDNLLNHPAS